MNEEETTYRPVMNCHLEYCVYLNLGTFRMRLLLRAKFCPFWFIVSKWMQQIPK